VSPTELYGSRIKVSGLQIFAFHGVLPEERARGQNFYIDLEVDYDFRQAAATDAIVDAVDYNRLVNEVASIASTETFDLIESLTVRLGEHILSDLRVSRALVRVHKPEAPLEQPVADLSVEAVFERGSGSG
jgi:dihydroneopterin aldolase